MAEFISPHAIADTFVEAAGLSGDQAETIRQQLGDYIREFVRWGAGLDHDRIERCIRRRLDGHADTDVIEDLVDDVHGRGTP